MNFRTAVVALISLTALSPARAELPPQYYERARADADSVIVVKIDKVDLLEAGVAEGSCTLHGTVTAVERGSDYREGTPVAVDLPCVSREWRPIPGPFPGYMERGLGRGLTGRLYLRNGNLVLRGYDQLTERPERS